MSDDETGQAMDGNVPAYASALVFLGIWGLVLAGLNMFSMAHPTYHVSWGGLLTFETTNAAFGEAKDGFHFEILGDTIFIAACVGLIALGTRVVNERNNVANWAQRIAHQRHLARPQRPKSGWWTAHDGRLVPPAGARLLPLLRYPTPRLD